MHGKVSKYTGLQVLRETHARVVFHAEKAGLKIFAYVEALVPSMPRTPPKRKVARKS